MNGVAVAACPHSIEKQRCSTDNNLNTRHISCVLRLPTRRGDLTLKDKYIVPHPLSALPFTIHRIIYPSKCNSSVYVTSIKITAEKDR